ncbi:MAG: hypothetical protein FWC41_08775, partial [Firmicutes bacterium]|nr:hypothetical protein [Bacillota bacterium]
KNHDLIELWTTHKSFGQRNNKFLQLTFKHLPSNPAKFIITILLYLSHFESSPEHINKMLFSFFIVP